MNEILAVQASRVRVRLVVAAAVSLVVVVTGCGGDDSDDDQSPQEANPASVYCAEQGGEVEIVDTDDGQIGMCNLPDGTSVDEWEYFRENNPDGTTP